MSARIGAEELKEAITKLKTQPRYLRAPSGKKVLKKAVKSGLDWKKLEELFGRSQSAIEKALSYHGVAKPRNKTSDYSEEQLKIAKEKYTASFLVESKQGSAELSQQMVQALNAQRLQEGKKTVSLNALRCAIHDLKPDWKWGWPAAKTTATSPRTKREEKPPEFLQRRWPEPETIEVPRDKWERPGARVAYLSYSAYRNSGWRQGLPQLAVEIAANYGCHFPVFAGGLLDKEWVQKEVKRLTANFGRRYAGEITEHVKDEIVRALLSTLPKSKKPDGSLARWYLMASIPYDGPEQQAEAILRRLQELREDVRQYKTGGERIEIKQPDGRPSIWHGVVLPKKRRLSSKYMSAKPERDIEDVEDQTSRGYPDLWVHGTSATAIFKPSGERAVPYITLPAIHKLEAEKKQIAENQVGLAIVEEMPDGDRLIHWWSLRDLIARERGFITGIKEGATDLHKKIVAIIKREGARHPGRLADELGIDRQTLNQEIQFLVEPKRSGRLTWPGLQYDEHSQRYDFHGDWTQEMLRYALPRDGEGWHEDSFLFFGCLHAGYTTTDYDFVVKNFPEIILKYGIKVLAGVGDFIAGLHHSFMHKGEIFQLNNTEQEQFAGEIVATVIYKVFTARFEEALKLFEGRTPTTEEITSLVDKSLLLFLIKKGNHDTWQEYDGNTALQKFYDTLTALLPYHLRVYLAGKGFTTIDPTAIVRKKTVLVPEHRPVYTLPSGINVGLTHPHMARADTTSLRAEKALKFFAQRYGCQVVGVANFHVAVCAHKWWPKNGQCVVMQTGTEVILTDFEYNKLKGLDFGPLLLKTLSYKGRIYRTTMAAFNKPLLTEEEIPPKWTDVTKLKKRLGLLGY
ncbi:MAG: hypothetical protein HYW89_01750 [Candidatus Sungiibacteriota bacterium]|uniref:Uncharacterized protein n=1 Tax=Candidatus Sungiibacteriota bacterium TaxID=2750080 RepID=A0A7T5RK59_9BACT|nr:MAG: hypothetical protein HYW89_01750 [Candidatus Sungbacteria bacterium]